MINIQKTVTEGVAQLFVGEVSNSIWLKSIREEDEIELTTIMEGS